MKYSIKNDSLATATVVASGKVLELRWGVSADADRVPFGPIRFAHQLEETVQQIQVHRVHGLLDDLTNLKQDFHFPELINQLASWFLPTIAELGVSKVALLVGDRLGSSFSASQLIANLKDKQPAGLDRALFFSRHEALQWLTSPTATAE